MGQLLFFEHTLYGFSESKYTFCGFSYFVDFQTTNEGIPSLSHSSQTQAVLVSLTIKAMF